MRFLLFAVVAACLCGCNPNEGCIEVEGASPFGILYTMKREKESSVRTAGTVLALIPILKGLGFFAYFL